jgi:hypothetical protein
MRAATVDQEVQAEHAAKEAELAAQRTGIEAEITQLRDFERDYRTRLRAYLEGQLNDLERLAAASSGPGSGVRVSGISSQRPGGSALPDSLPPLATPPSFSGPFSSAASPVSPPEPAETASAPPDPEPVTPPAPSEDSPAPITGPRHASLSAFDTDVDAGSDAPSAPPVEPDDDTDESSD